MHCYAEVSRQVYRSVVDAEASVVVLIIGEVQFLCLEAQFKGTCGRDVCDGNFRTIVCGNSVAIAVHLTDAEVCRQGECSRLYVGDSCRDVAEVESDTDFGPVLVLVNLSLIKTFYSLVVAMIFEHHDLG